MGLRELAQKIDEIAQSLSEEGIRITGYVPTSERQDDWIYLFVKNQNAADGRLVLRLRLQPVFYDETIDDSLITSQFTLELYSTSPFPQVIEATSQQLSCSEICAQGVRAYLASFFDTPLPAARSAGET
jgi:hypothetical protein